MSLVISSKAPRNPHPLTRIGYAAAGRAARHQFVRECRAALEVLKEGKDEDNGGVVGTANMRRAELYGWINPVTTHIDNTDGDRYMYGLVVLGTCQVSCLDPVDGRTYSLHLGAGNMFRMNDRLPHWTKGRGIVVCVFTGCYDSPDDDGARRVLERGLQRLKNGVHTAPRVSSGFRALPGYVWAWDADRRWMARAEAARRMKWDVIPCFQCEAPAFEIDGHFPYAWELNRCAQHMKEPV